MPSKCCHTALTRCTRCKITQGHRNVVVSVCIALCNPLRAHLNDHYLMCTHAQCARGVEHERTSRKTCTAHKRSSILVVFGWGMCHCGHTCIEMQIFVVCNVAQITPTKMEFFYGAIVTANNSPRRRRRLLHILYGHTYIRAHLDFMCTVVAV